MLVVILFNRIFSDINKFNVSHALYCVIQKESRETTRKIIILNRYFDEHNEKFGNYCN